MKHTKETIDNPIIVVENVNRSIYSKLKSVSKFEDREDYLDKKKSFNKDLYYLRWAKAFDIAFSEFGDDVEYGFLDNPVIGLPIFGNAKMGYFVKTYIKIKGIQKTCHLAVTDNSNNPLKDESYKKGSIDVIAINVHEINSTIQRCYVKNLAMHGVALDLYTDGDLNYNDETENKSFKTINDTKELKNIVNDEKIQELKTKCLQSLEANKTKLTELAFNTFTKQINNSSSTSATLENIYKKISELANANN